MGEVHKGDVHLFCSRALPVAVLALVLVAFPFFVLVPVSGAVCRRG
ncbi:hypothetical protein [Streptomyces sp. CS227]|nr:hypothetical protein [Streptomyces sp. CS227]